MDTDSDRNAPAYSVSGLLVASDEGSNCHLINPSNLMPRYWATAYMRSQRGRRWSLNTRKLQLRHIGYFYQLCDARCGVDALDEAISNRDQNACQQMIEMFHAVLTDDPEYTSTTVQRWNAVRGFLAFFAKRLAPQHNQWREFRLLLRASKLRSPDRGKFKFVRALPATTLADLLTVAAPGAARNPFRRAEIQWRNWLILNLLLLCGLRRGEALLLVVDSLKHDLDPDTGEISCWLDITTTVDDDPRATRPSIKTENSHRQIPMSSSMVQLYEYYITVREQQGGNPYLLTSQAGRPLSAEAINKIVKQLSGSLLPVAIQRFLQQVGKRSGKKYVWPHCLRHTCATARYNMFMAQNDNNRELTLQKMRAFFGWSIESDMPDLYASASIKDDLLRTWKDHFDHAALMLRCVEL